MLRLTVAPLKKTKNVCKERLWHNSPSVNMGKQWAQWKIKENWRLTDSLSREWTVLSGVSTKYNNLTFSFYAVSAWVFWPTKEARIWKEKVKLVKSGSGLNHCASQTDVWSLCLCFDWPWSVWCQMLSQHCSTLSVHFRLLMREKYFSYLTNLLPKDNA